MRRIVTLASGLLVLIALTAGVAGAQPQGSIAWDPRVAADPVLQQEILYRERLGYTCRLDYPKPGQWFCFPPFRYTPPPQFAPNFLPPLPGTPARRTWCQRDPINGGVVCTQQ